MTNPTVWNQVLVWPITNLLVIFYKFFEWLHIPGPFGWAIIALTVAIRFLIYPLMHAQLSSAKKMNELKPHLDALSAKHKDDKKALQQAQLDLYKQRGINPAAGCLPTLIQFPILIALYNVFDQVLGAKDLSQFIGEVNKILYIPSLHMQTLDITFFCVNLAMKPAEWQKYGWWLLTIPLVTAVLQWYQSKLMLPKTMTPAVKPEGTKEEKKTDDMGDMQKQMALMMPIMFGFFALQFPLGLALYWNVFGLFGIIQQIKINTSTS